MSGMIGLVNYGMAGNIYSIRKALEKAGADVVLVEDARALERVDKIVLPGVGSFADAMSEIHKAALFEPLRNAMQEKPTLGICLGMQILASLGFEFGETKGFDLVGAEVKPMVCHGQVPHMGFNDLQIVRPSALLNGIEDEQFYFMHSYEMVNYTDVAALTTYAGHTFVSSVQKETLFGVQFHPEKSRDAGIELFKNFMTL